MPEAKSRLYLGDERSGALKALQGYLSEQAMAGKRIQVFCAGGTQWTDMTVPVDYLFPPYHRSHVVPAGRVQVMEIAQDESGLRGIWEIIDPKTPGPAPVDLFAFVPAARSIGTMHFQLPGWVQEWEQRGTEIVFYGTDKDTLREGVAIKHLSDSCREVLLFGMEPASDLVRSWAAHDGIPLNDIRNLANGEYITVEDPWSLFLSMPPRRTWEPLYEEEQL